MAVESFLRDCRLISLGVRLGSSTREITQGVGPERAALRHGCTVLTQRHHYWQQVPSSRMFRPVFLPGAMALPERIKTFHAHGIFLALHCFLLQHGPQPISIWLLLALIKGKEAMLIPKHILLHLDPGAYDILAPWYDFHQDTAVPPPAEASHPLRVFIFEYMFPAIQPNLINNHRTKEEHEGWIISAFATILLGHPAPWDVPEFIALRDAFNTALGTLRFSDTLRGLDASAFLVTIYDRRVTAVDQVADHLRFQVVSRASDLTTPYFVKLFKLRLHHYLRGVGHPSELCERLQAFGVSEQEFIASRYDPLLRANLMLLCGSDSDMRPTLDDWSIVFQFQGRDAPNSVLGTPLSFHTCFYSIDVYLDPVLREVLLEPVGGDPGRSSKFALWLHEQLVNPNHNAS
ncbi:hypothetical protein B0H10DRAFT_2231418 [Mycena sp. CBHHK59/15]|nr:hypothetical protein B0H10DRAFT_2231418 [Mycena sp. CBHHK59/15]